MSEPGEEDSPDLSYWLGLLGLYKIPLLFFLTGLVLLGGGLMYLLMDRQKAPEITIEHSNRESANKLGDALIIVDVSGAVKKPGVVKLSGNSRLQEALIQAGGFAQNADVNWITKNLNLAAKLIDGQKIYVPFEKENYSTANNSNISPDFNNRLININSASSQELEELPGVGEVTAQKIIESRPYETIGQLLEKKIVGKSVFEKIKDQITVY
ncbi:ComEA family DNA-binding protein [Candidatus Microgenomates bacterium]|nr:ComEA family DNA-binding protein [Candidatus Microgenomates bacterium]